jgi:hypothetical protein
MWRKKRPATVNPNLPSADEMDASGIYELAHGRASVPIEAWEHVPEDDDTDSDSN